MQMPFAKILLADINAHAKMDTLVNIIWNFGPSKIGENNQNREKGYISVLKLGLRTSAVAIHTIPILKMDF